MLDAAVLSILATAIRADVVVRGGKTVTRELKLALVVGFSLLLVVTVLISDHLSKARTTELAKDIPENPAMTPKAPRESLLASGAGQPESMDNTIRDPAGMSRPSGELPPPGPAPSPEVSKPFEINQGGTTRTASADEGIIVPVDAPVRGVPAVGTQQVSPEGLAGASRQLVQQPDPKLVTPGDSMMKPANDPSKSEQAKLAKGSSDPMTKQAAGNAPVSGQLHTVAAGENLSKIARRYYGDSKQWKRIADANPKVIGKNGEVRVGSKLTIPSLETKQQPEASPKSTPVVPVRAIAGDTPTKAPAKELPKTTLKDPKATELAKADRPVVKEPVGKPDMKGAKVYTVKSGDTLSQIAQRELGSVNRIKDIVHMNKDLLGKDATSVRVGMVLKLPKA